MRLTEASIKKAVAAASAGERYDVFDSAAPGLVLRVAPRGVAWGLKFTWGGQTKRLRLGSSDLVSLPIAREIAAAARTLLREQRECPTEAWVTEQLVRRRVLVSPQAEHTVLRRPTTWTFAEARDAYLVEVKRTRRETTWRDRRNMLNIAELKPFNDRLVASISRREVAALAAEIHRSGRERHAGHLCEVIRPMWKWLAGDAQQIRSGVLEGEMGRLRPPETTNREDEEPRTYCPPPEELGRLLAIACSGVLDRNLADALLLALYTAQRRRSIVNARLADFIEEPDGSFTWAIPPIHRKTGRGKNRTHDLPLPLAAAEMVRRRIDAADGENGSLWIFPSARPRRAGEDLGHIHPDTLTHLFDALPGIKATPHDVRRGFATHLEDLLGFEQSEIKLVLDHSEGKSASDVTERAYSRARRLAKKRAMLDPWAELIEGHASAIDLGDHSALLRAIKDGYLRQKTPGKQ